MLAVFVMYAMLTLCLNVAVEGQSSAVFTTSEITATATQELGTPGCSIVSTLPTVTNNTPQAITGGGTVSSNIVISSPQLFIYDVDVITNITHTYSADVDMTIRSPAGTIVTLTTENGGSNDNVFAGTTWDDSADPDGLPTATFQLNANQVQTHPYANNVVATPLSPEEALSAFVGENPNGTWTLTVDDNFAGADDGMLNSWGLSIKTIPSLPTTASTTINNTTPVAINDNSVITSTISTAAPGRIVKVTVATNITHTAVGDLQFTITSPSGRVVTLSNGILAQGAGADDVWAGTTWDDDADPDGQVPYATNANHGGDHPYVTGVVATPLTPVEAFGAFRGEVAAGTWTLTVADQFGGDTGTLNSWGITIVTENCVTAGETTVSGRVLTSNGRGLANAKMVLTDPSTGVTKLTTTTRGGSFEFQNVDAGRTYVISVNSRLYSYTPQTVTVNDNVSDIVFTPEDR